MERSHDLIHALRSRSTISVVPKERPRAAFILGTDIEGPHALGDTVDQAMVLRVKPRNAVNAFPMHGHIIYEETFNWFTSATLADRRPMGRSLAQEGTDTIFTLPLLLASGVDKGYLIELTMRSAATPGASELVEGLEGRGVIVYGITTAPEDPYKAFFRQNAGLNPDRIIGSPFPIDETKSLLAETGRYDIEMTLVNRFLTDCFRIIDSCSQIKEGMGGLIRSLSEEGQSALRDRAAQFYKDELGISYSMEERLGRGPAKTVLGQVIEACGMVGDRAKAAVALTALYANGGAGSRLITMGDGANDRGLLASGHLSIGVNGADAAKAAKIAFVGSDMRDVAHIIEPFMQGQTNLRGLVNEAQRNVSSGAIVALGGPDCDPDVLACARKMKADLRGQYVTY